MQCPICLSTDTNELSQHKTEFSDVVPEWCNVYPWDKMIDVQFRCLGCGFEWIDTHENEVEQMELKL